MKDLSGYFQNPFSDDKLTLDSKKKFSEDALKRIATQNTANQFSDALLALDAAHTALFGAITTVATVKAISEARTQSVDKVIAAFAKRNTKLNRFLTMNEVNTTPVYQEFFPRGVTEFTDQLTKGNVEQQIAFLVAAIQANTAVAGGAAVLAEYQQIASDYKAARGQQLTKFGETSSGRSSRQAAEDTWDDTMFGILLTAANLHRNQPEKVSLFFNQSILRSPRSAATDGRGRIAGIITQGGKPAEGIKVHVVDGNVHDETTDSTGGYITNSLPVGKYSVVFTLPDQSQQTLSVVVVDDGDTQLDAAL